MENVKPCPFCGEQILAVAVKCKHCGSAVGASPNAVRRQLKMRPWAATLGVIVLGLIGVGFLINWNQTGSVSGQGFTSADITQAEANIRSEYAKKNLKVTDVELIRESPTKLTGYVRMKMPLIGTVSKNCTATLGEDHQYIWQCQ